MALGVRDPGADVALVHHTDAGSQYTSSEYTQTLDDHLVLASIGTVGDALDNALAESFVDSYKTELIADRVWRNQTQLELATVAWVAWFNHDRLHCSLGDIPPVEFERNYYAATALTRRHRPTDQSCRCQQTPQTGLQRVTSLRPASISLPTARSLPPPPWSSQPGSAQAATTPVKGRTAAVGLSDG